MLQGSRYAQQVSWSTASPNTASASHKHIHNQRLLQPWGVWASLLRGVGCGCMWLHAVCWSNKGYSSLYLFLLACNVDATSCYDCILTPNKCICAAGFGGCRSVQSFQLAVADGGEPGLHWSGHSLQFSVPAQRFPAEHIIRGA